MKNWKLSIALACFSLSVASASAWAQKSSASSASPFEALSKAQQKALAGMSKTQALAQLSATARAKVNGNYLDSLFSSDASSFIVEYHAHGATKIDAKSAITNMELAARKTAYSETKKQISNNFKNQGFEVIRDFDALPMAYVQVNSRNLLIKLLENQTVKAVYENQSVQPALNESLPLIGLPSPLSNGNRGGGEGTAIAVLDTGVNFAHAAFGSCSAPNVPATTCRVVAALAPPQVNDPLGISTTHGTVVSAVAAAVAPKTKIVSIKIFWTDRFKPSGVSSNFATVIDGINIAINKRLEYNIVAMNISVETNRAFWEQCTNAWSNTPLATARAVGILPVVATGNHGHRFAISEPACDPSAVSVGAEYDATLSQAEKDLINRGCTDFRMHAGRAACFSNISEFTTLLAPGAMITTAGESVFGTSVAAPHVAGAIAILRSRTLGAAPCDTLDETVQRLVKTGRRIGVGDATWGTVDWYSRQALNVGAALRSITTAYNGSCGGSGGTGTSAL